MRTEDGAVRPVDRDAIAADLDRCRADLLALLDAATRAELRAPSNGTKWTNEQLLFHMVFGFLVVRRLLPLVRVMSVAPGWVGRSFAALLDAARVPFHWVNYAGSCGGALVFNHARMGRLCNHTIDHLVASLRQEPEERLGRGMRFPPELGPVLPAAHDRRRRLRLPRVALRPPSQAAHARSIAARVAQRGVRHLGRVRSIGARFLPTPGRGP